jgi:hypothetical protein
MMRSPSGESVGAVYLLKFMPSGRSTEKRTNGVGTGRALEK